MLIRKVPKIPKFCKFLSNRNWTFDRNRKCKPWVAHRTCPEVIVRRSVVASPLCGHWLGSQRCGRLDPSPMHRDMVDTAGARRCVAHTVGSWRRVWHPVVARSLASNSGQGRDLVKHAQSSLSNVIPALSPDGVRNSVTSCLVNPCEWRIWEDLFSLRQIGPFVTAYQWRTKVPRQR